MNWLTFRVHIDNGDAKGDKYVVRTSTKQQVHSQITHI